MTELIVHFVAGTDEASARSSMEQMGGFIRRRMRADDTDEVMLLVRFDEEAEEKVKAHPRVDWVERNAPGFRPMSTTDS